MSSAISASNFIEAMKGWSTEELEQVRSAIQALAPKKEKVAKAPAAPVLDPAYVVAEPATKGAHKGKPRWQNTDTENYVYEFPAVAPAAKKVKAPAPAPAPAAKPAPSAGSMSDEQLMGRMSKKDVGALSKEDKKRRNELKKAATEERKKNRSPEDQAKIDAKVAKMQAARAAKKNAAGGSAEAEDEESGSGSAADE
jgi:hypothetical protein